MPKIYTFSHPPALPLGIEKNSWYVMVPGDDPDNVTFYKMDSFDQSVSAKKLANKCKICKHASIYSTTLDNPESVCFEGCNVAVKSVQDLRDVLNECISCIKVDF